MPSESSEDREPSSYSSGCSRRADMTGITGVEWVLFQPNPQTISSCTMIGVEDRVDAAIIYLKLMSSNGLGPLTFCLGSLTPAAMILCHPGHMIRSIVRTGD